MWRALVALALLSTAFLSNALLSTCALAQNFAGYRETTLDALFQTWNDITKEYGAGVSILRPDTIRFVATLRSLPVPCSNAPLVSAMRVSGYDSFLQQVSVTHCVTLVSKEGRTVVAFVQDVLVPGLNADAKPDGALDIHAVVFAFVVDADRARNYPMMVVGAFEPQ
jgi:hypothetical protein